MSGSALVGLLGILCGLLSLLSWIGWRFFVMPMPVARATVTVSVSPSLITNAEPRTSTPDRFESSHLPKRLYWSAALVLLVGGLVVGGVFLMSGSIAPEPLELFELDRQAHIQGALNPERLVPPPALPPDMFVSSDRPALETADRDWGKLNPAYMQSILHLMARLESRGYRFVLLEGYRSPERQEKLANLGNHVTSARAFQSKHQYGLAVDLAPVREGKLLISERDPWAMEAYLALGEEAAKAGLTWGGVWWFKDYGHVEMTGSIAALGRAGQ